MAHPIEELTLDLELQPQPWLLELCWSPLLQTHFEPCAGSVCRPHAPPWSLYHATASNEVMTWPTSRK